MAVVLNNRNMLVRGHDCQDELPGAYAWRTIDKVTREGVPKWTVVRCSCTQLWVAYPYANFIVWKTAGLWHRLRYRGRGLDQEA